MNEYIGKSLGKDWSNMVTRTKLLLQDESELEEIVRLVGVDSLSEKDRLKLETAKMIREDFLQQNAFDDVDTYTSREKQYEMLATILNFEDEARAGMELGAYFAEIKKGTAAAREQIAKSKYFPEDQIAKFEVLRNDIKEAVHEVVSEGGMETNA